MGLKKTQYGGIRGKGCVYQSFEEIELLRDVISQDRASLMPRLDTVQAIYGNEFWVDDHRSLGLKSNNCDVDQVRDLLNLKGDGWNREILSSLFPHNITSKIACCFVSKSRNDVLYWHNNPGAQFSLKSAYLLATKADEDMAWTTISDDLNDFWRVVWKARVPSKVKLFMWRVWNNYVPIIANLQSRGLDLTSSCTHCSETTKYIVHVMFKCSIAKELSSRMEDIHDDIVGIVEDKKQMFSWPVEWLVGFNGLGL
ncbi:reverse transcriptase [Tanacetum coccineum]